MAPIKTLHKALICIFVCSTPLPIIVCFPSRDHLRSWLPVAPPPPAAQLSASLQLAPSPRAPHATWSTSNTVSNLSFNSSTRSDGLTSQSLSRLASVHCYCLNSINLPGLYCCLLSWFWFLFCNTQRNRKSVTLLYTQRKSFMRYHWYLQIHQLTHKIEIIFQGSPGTFYEVSKKNPYFISFFFHWLSVNSEISWNSGFKKRFGGKTHFRCRS